MARHYCIHTIHYEPAGSTKTVVAEAGSEVDDLKPASVERLTAKGAIREIEEKAAAPKPAKKPGRPSKAEKAAEAAAAKAAKERDEAKEAAAIAEKERLEAEKAEAEAKAAKEAAEQADDEGGELA